MSDEEFAETARMANGSDLTECIGDISRENAAERLRQGKIEAENRVISVIMNALDDYQERLVKDAKQRIRASVTVQELKYQTEKLIEEINTLYIDQSMKLEDLKKRIPYHWKIQTGKRGDAKAACVAYVDARDVMDLLDSVVGPGGWSDTYIPLDPSCKNVQCTISLKIENEWVTKQDVGTASDMDPEKGAYSDAFKRAAVKWGIGRFLYDLDIEWVALNADGKPIDENGQRIYNLTQFIESRQAKKIPSQQQTVARQAQSVPTTKTCNVCNKPHSGPYTTCIDCYRAKQQVN